MYPRTIAPQHIINQRFSAVKTIQRAAYCTIFPAIDVVRLSSTSGLDAENLVPSHRVLCAAPLAVETDKAGNSDKASKSDEQQSISQLSSPPSFDLPFDYRMDPASIASLCFVIAENVGAIIVDAPALKEKIAGAQRSLKEVIAYVGILQQASQTLAEHITQHPSWLPADSTEKAAGSLRACEAILVVISRYISKIQPRGPETKLGFKGTFRSVWHEDALKSARDVIQHQV